MKQVMRKIRYMLAAVLFVSVSAGCTEFLKEKPKYFHDPDEYYTDNEALLAGMSGVYATLTEPNYYGVNFPLVADMFGDMGATVNGTAFQPFTNPRGGNPLIPTATMVTRIWNALYYTVNQANTFIDRAENAPAGENIDEELRRRVIGEAKFIRALSYFNLVRCWGAIPLRKERARDFTDPRIEASPVKDVFDFILEDLEYAESNCWNKGEARGAFTNDIGRVTKMAATALTAKVYLEMASSSRYSGPDKNSEYHDVFEEEPETYYALCRDYCTMTIENEDFGWVEDWADIWSVTNQNNAEFIFSVQYAASTPDGSSYFISFTPRQSTINTPGIHKGAFGLNNAFINIYKEAPWNINSSDYRFASGMLMSFSVKDAPEEVITWDEATCKYINTDNWSDGNKVGGQLRSAKFVDADALLDNSSSLDWPVIRAAEIYLMRAEALAELSGNPADGYADFNKVRARGRSTLLDDDELSTYVLGDSSPMDQFHDAILRERIMEFMLEGYRWFDLKRLGLLAEVTQRMGVTNSGKQRVRDVFSDYWMPYPSDELNGNTWLEQKPGY